MKRLLLILLPFLITVTTGATLYYCAVKFTNGDMKDLLINIAATLFAVPLVYIVYETIRDKMTNRLRVEIYEYAKMQIDRNLLSVLFKLMNIIYSVEHKKTTANLTTMFKLTRYEIKDLLSKDFLLGFQIWKNLDVDENEIDKILQNPYILKNLEDVHIIQIIHILRSVKHYNQILPLYGLFEEQSHQTKDYIISRGTKMQIDNKKYPNRYILLKPLKHGSYMVAGFGDFDEMFANNLLSQYAISHEYIDQYTDILYTLLVDIRQWVEITKSEILIDTSQFRLRETIPEAWSKEFL